MPTYSYRCPACEHRFQQFEKMSASPRPICPACGQRAERRITGGAGLVLKGSHAPESPGPGSCCGGACGCH